MSQGGITSPSPQHPPLKSPHLSLHSLSSHLPDSGLISKYSATNLSCYFFRSSFSLPLKLRQQPTSSSQGSASSPTINQSTRQTQAVHSHRGIPEPNITVRTFSRCFQVARFQILALLLTRYVNLNKLLHLSKMRIIIIIIHRVCLIFCTPSNTL